MERSAGILLSIASLPSQYGIGDFGLEAHKFIDTLKNNHIKLWQILPLNPLGFGNSPYQPYSSKAMDELYISPYFLKEEGLLTKTYKYESDELNKIDYQSVRDFKQTMLATAFKNFKSRKDFKDFNSWLEKNPWVENYTLFITFKKLNNLKMWTEWPHEQKYYTENKSFKLGHYKNRILYEKWIQYTLFKQWSYLREYANKNDVKIIGDVPFYVGIDSVDVWENKLEFLLDVDGNPTSIAGVPPDYFSITGQRWGNPIYNWEIMKNNRYKFWIDRMTFNAKVFDIVRIDHFRAFDTYWKIPATCPTAIEGEWITGPSYDFFDEYIKEHSLDSLVIEDLGDLFDSVLTLRDHYSLPGMNILQFTFDASSYEYGLKDRENQIIYTGTHDNETIRGWINSLNEEERNKIREKLDRLGCYGLDFNRAFIKLCLENKANYAIIPIQDILNLGNEARINTPSTVGSPNWEWKLDSFELFNINSIWLRDLILKTNRE